MLGSRPCHNHPFCTFGSMDYESVTNKALVTDALDTNLSDTVTATMFNLILEVVIRYSPICSHLILSPTLTPHSYLWFYVTEPSEYITTSSTSVEAIICHIYRSSIPSHQSTHSLASVIIIGGLIFLVWLHCIHSAPVGIFSIAVTF